nr:hypothetical protein [Eubacterium sp.]
KSLCNATFWAGEREGILYRKQFFDYNTRIDYHWMQSLFLADFPVPLGLIRVDKLKLFRRPVVLTLGSYGFPDNGTEIITEEEGDFKAIILKGKDSLGNAKQMAMTIFAGFSGIHVTKSEGTNPDSQKSMVIFGEAALNKQYGGAEPYIYISQVITKNGCEEDFTREELFPISKVIYTDGISGAFGPVTLEMRDGSQRVVDYQEMEGNIML